MPDFARWQWDDLGQWRDFAEQYQAEIEAAFHNRLPSLELTIPPFGTFSMDLRMMLQVTVRGRNPGYMRDIRRQVRKIEVGYFIQGHEGDISASDEAIDQIDDVETLEALVRLLANIVEDPEDFGRRSANLEEGEFAGTLGICDDALEFLQERGFEEIEDGESRFVVFIQEDIPGLREAIQEVEARLLRVRKRERPSASNALASEGREVASNDVFESNAAQEGEGCESNAVLEASDQESQADTTARQVAGVEDERGHVVLSLPCGREFAVELAEDTLGELLSKVVGVSGFRLPLVRTPEGGDERLGLAAEPGARLSVVAKLHAGERLRVEDFEGVFVERLSGGLLRLQDLAVVAPLLAWQRPELPKLVMGRMKSLLEGSAEHWCKAAGCATEQELLYGRALLRYLHAAKLLDERLEICRQLLPSERRVKRSVLQVDRADFIRSAVGGLEKLPPERLRRTFAVEFLGEVAEDHGGPRRDFFGNIGARLAVELPRLWRRLPGGALAPVADVVAEGARSEERLEAEDAWRVYRACGRACALALKSRDVIGEFAGFFLHQVLCGDCVSLEELQRQLAESHGDGDILATRAVLERELPELGLDGMTFTRTVSHTDVEVELMPGGRSTPVTEENKAQWLRLHLHDKLYRSVRKAADAFRSGLLEVLGGGRSTSPFLVLLTPAELLRAWAGSAVSDVDVRKWRSIASVSGEIETQAAWLWELLEDRDGEFRGRVLKFATGASRLGSGGLQAFEVQPADGGDEFLPRAMTCANMLQLPRYSSKAILELQLRRAMQLCDCFQVL